MTSTLDQNHDTSLFPLCSDRVTDDPPMDDDIDLSLLTREVIRGSESLVDWYKNKIIYRRSWARILRFFMILAAGVATLIPLLAEVLKNGNTAIISPGFSAVFLALSGIIFAMEKYFGHANAWIRFVKAKLGIEAKIEQLKLQWLEVKLQQKMGKNTDVADWLHVLKEHQEQVNDIVENETDTWIKEFQAAMAENNIAKSDTKRALR